MDFIEDLSCIHGKSVILTVVDHFSKHAHFITLSHPYMATSVVKAFFEAIILVHGFPNSIMSDHDPVFIEHIWHDHFKLVSV